jgi:hypothetical protein
MPERYAKECQMYHDIDYALGRERVVQMRTEVEHNRLESRLTRAARSDEGNVARRGRVARGVALVTAPFR